MLNHKAKASRGSIEQAVRLANEADRAEEEQRKAELIAGWACVGQPIDPVRLGIWDRLPLHVQETILESLRTEIEATASARSTDCKAFIV